MALYPAFELTQFMVRRKVLKLLGGAFHIYDPSGQVVFFSELKAFKLKEDIRIYDNPSKTLELLSIRARQVIDFSASYDVYDSTTQERIAVLQRKGMKSILSDEWIIKDAQEREIGLIKEDSMVMALIRRFLSNLIPQSFKGTVNGQPVLEFKQHFNPFVPKITLNFAVDTHGLLDRRIGIAAAILMSAIEGRQN